MKVHDNPSALQEWTRECGTTTELLEVLTRAESRVAAEIFSFKKWKPGKNRGILQRSVE